MANNIAELSTATFDETINGSTKPVLVDFWAEWCGPCKMITPVLEEIATEYGDNISITKLNVDDHPEIAARYSVMSIPTILVFDGGDVRHKIVGAKGKGALVEELSKFLGTSH